MNNIHNLINELIEELDKIEDTDKKIEVINKIKIGIHKISPFKKEPIDCVVWVKSNRVIANDYNPNKVATPEMKLLHTSIRLDGFTQPIVTYSIGDNVEVVDGFHRSRVGKEYKDISGRTKGYLPITTIDKDKDERMGSTIRHNRARGTHQIQSMSDIVLKLSEDGWEEEEICKKIGMDLDEVIRLKQITGLKSAFQNHEFSKSWEEFEKNNYSEN